MDERALGPEAGPLQRARLHIRGGKRRIRQGKVSEGIVTLYDALNAAMEWYFASEERRGRLAIGRDDDLRDDRTLYDILTRSGVLDGSFDYRTFDKLIEEISFRDFRGYDHDKIVAGIDYFMTQLGVMPFDEGELPPEDASTF